MTKFKNLRRPPRKRSCDDDTNVTGQASTKKKCSSKRLYFPPSVTEEISIDEPEAKLSHEWAKPKPKRKIVRQCLSATLKDRQEWIQESCPVVCDVLEKYPMLKKGRWVSVKSLHACMISFKT